MKALLLIDIQNDFLPGGALAVPGGDAILPVVNQLQEQFGLVAATQDWHPRDHRSFASQHAGKQVYDVVDLQGLEQVLWPDHCVQGTSGADFSEKLLMNSVEIIFRKGLNPVIDSYSGFYDNGHLKSTGLADYLRSKDITDIYLAGLAADYCVYYSAKDALQEGFKAYIVEDAVRAISPEGFERAKAGIKAGGGEIVHSSSLR